MRSMNVWQFRRLSKVKMRELLPIKLTIGGQDIPREEVCIVGSPNETIILSDLHPIMQTKLRNIELQARSAMPKQPDETIVVDEKGEISIEVK